MSAESRLSQAVADWKDGTHAAKTIRRPLPLISLGCTGFSGKLDALLWALRLETPDLDYYCQSIVSLVSDQGCEYRLPKAPRVDIKSVQREWEQVLNASAPELVESDCEMDLGPDPNLLQLRPGQPQPVPQQPLPPQPLPPQPDDVDPDHSLLDQRQFPNALRIAGALHVSDNCLGSSLEAMSTWRDLLKNLRVVEILLKDIKFRERFQHFNVTDKSSKDKLKNWSLSLRGLRWQSVLRFTAELVPLEKILRQFWNKDVFMGRAGDHEPENDAAKLGNETETSESFGVTVNKLDKVLTDPSFWGQVHMVCDLAQEANVVPEFAEGCPCHGPHHDEEDEDANANAGPSPISNPQAVLRKLCPGPTPLPSECSFKGCRAPEMALNRALSIQRMRLEEDREPCPLWRALV